MTAISGQPATQFETRHSRTPTRDGLILVGEHHELPSCRSRIVLLHGFGEHRGRYRPLVADLLGAGYACHSFDLRGHGASGGVRGHVSSFDEYLDDLDCFLNETFQSPPGGLVLLGHSLGGLIALEFVLHRASPIAALVLSSPFLQPAFDLPPFMKAFVLLVSRLLPKLHFKAPLKPTDLSRDPGIVQRYCGDPQIVRSVTMAWAASAARAQQDVYARAAEVTMPALFLVGGADRVADPERTRALFARLGSHDKRLTAFEGFYHEVFNEPERQRVVADLLAWLDDRFPANGSNS